MVTILSVAFTLDTGIEHERATPPLMCTEHAPHCATPQPDLVPVRPPRSRMTAGGGVSAALCTSRTRPLMLSFAMHTLRVDLRVGLHYPRETTMTTVETARGPVDTAQLGPTLMHEHVVTRSPGVQENW